MNPKAKTAPACLTPSAASAILMLVVMMTATCCYLNTLGAEFVNWDDPKLIIQNPFVRGISWENLKHIWTAPIKETYLPLRATSYMIDYELWGGYDPLGFHLTNVMLHALVSIVAMRIVQKLSGSQAAGFIAGMLFAVHPVHTEVVAWVSARKDLLSTLLFFISYLLYLDARRAPSAGCGASGDLGIDAPRGIEIRWGLAASSLAVFLLSGLAKAMVVTLPALIILTDFIFLDLSRGRWRRLLPVWGCYFAVAALITGIAVYFASAAGAIRPWHFGGVLRTALFMSWVALFYIKTLFWPSFLCARYPYGDTLSYGVAEPMLYASPILLGAAVLLVVWLLWRARGSRAGGSPMWLKVTAFGMGWFFVSITPVMNFVSINVLVADRYLYLPSFGWLAAEGALLAMVWGRWSTVARGGFRRVIAGGLVVALVGLGAAATVRRNRVWHDSLSLWTSVAKEFPDSFKAHTLLGSAYFARAMPDVERALAELDVAGRLAPWAGEPHYSRGRLYMHLGKDDEAREEFTTALYKFGNKYRQSGEWELAIEYYKRAVRDRAGFVEAMIGLGEACAMVGRRADAAAVLARALREAGSDELRREAADLVDRLDLAALVDAAAEKPPTEASEDD